MSYWPFSCNHLQNIWNKGKENLVRHQKSQNIMNMILGFHSAINNDFWWYLEITFRRHLAIILKISVRFTLKELRYVISSSFDIISGSDEGGILLKKKKKVWEQKKTSGTGIFSQTRRKKTINNLTINKTSREGVFFS